MAEISYRRHRFPPVIIPHAVWLYLRFTLSYRDVEELLAERGLDISYESVRSWVLKSGPMIARRLRQVRPRPSDRWHLDEMVVRIAGKRMYLWRAVDHEGGTQAPHRALALCHHRRDIGGRHLASGRLKALGNLPIRRSREDSARTAD
jgi:transposase-like protein